MNEEDMHIVGQLVLGQGDEYDGLGGPYFVQNLNTSFCSLAVAPGPSSMYVLQSIPIVLVLYLQFALC
jgi:hypothetical protein